MTPDEAKILNYITIKGVASWSQLRGQFCLSEGLLTIILNSLKRHVQIEQNGLYYRITSIGKVALEQLTNPPRPEPFAGQPEW